MLVSGTGGLLGDVMVLQCNVIMIRNVLLIASPENAALLVEETVGDIGGIKNLLKWKTGHTVSNGGISPLSKNLHTYSEND